MGRWFRNLGITFGVAFVCASATLIMYLPRMLAANSEQGKTCADFVRYAAHGEVSQATRLLSQHDGARQSNTQRIIDESRFVSHPIARIFRLDEHEHDQHIVEGELARSMFGETLAFVCVVRNGRIEAFAIAGDSL